MKDNFKRNILLLVVLVMTLGVLAGCGGNEDVEEPVDEVEDTGEEATIMISAAASLTDVLGELEEMFNAENPKIKIDSTFASSGALQAQIEEGAPVDIFMSAAEKQMDALEEQELLLEDTRKTLLINEVVLITPKDSNLEISSVEDLAKAEVGKIAIGDPESVPVGQYSQEIFTSLNILDDISDKLVNAEDVRTVLSWVESGEVDCGLVYATDAYTMPDGVEIIAPAPQDSYKEVTYPVAIIKDSQNSEAAKKFLDFLYTPEAKKVFESYGFGVK